MNSEHSQTPTASVSNDAAAPDQIRPATPLPWQAHHIERWHITAVASMMGPSDEQKRNIDYALHACNAYPELVAVLRIFANCDLDESNCASLEVATRRIHTIARPLLRELGELS
jgi:hypothetical protein